MSDLSESLAVALVLWVTWAICSRLIFWHEWFTHTCSFVLSDLSEWENSLHWCTPWSLTPWWEAHGGAWLCGMMHTAELELQTTEIFEKFGSLDSAVWCTQRSLTLWYDAHRGVWFCGVHHTAESYSLDYASFSSGAQEAGMGLLYTVVAICVQAETSRRGNPPVGFGYKYPICDMALLYGNILFSTL